MPDTKGTALITGASSGLGAEYARQLAAQGHDLILVARREERLRALAAELEAKHPITAEVIVADLVQEADVANLVTSIEAHSPLEILVNNAGFNPFGLFAEVDFSRVLDMMTLHMQTSIRLTHAALPGMLERNQGVIILVSSTGSFTPLPHTATYGATKAFLNHFAEALSLELMGTGVVVQALCPGVTKTDLVNTPEFRASGFSEKSMPAWMWMEAETVVRTSLARIGRGSVIVVPGWWNKFTPIASGFRDLPILRPLARRMFVNMVRRMRRV